jgi:tetratricopeptide (TPR) repeat protein
VPWVAVSGLLLAWPEPARPYDEAGGVSKQGESAPKRGSGWGRRAEKPDGGGGWTRTYTVDERTGKRMAEALELLQAERYPEAREALGKLRMGSLNPFEKAQVLRIQAFIAYGDGQLGEARELLEQALAQDVLDVEEQAAIRFQIAQLYLAEERWRDVVTNLEQWFSMVESPNSSAYYLLAIAYYQLEDLDSALPPALKALEVAEVPQEGWLQLVLALRLTRKEYAEAVPLLEQLIHRYPKKIYWIQLSTVHGALGSYEEALIPLQLAYSQGLLTEDEALRRLSQLLLFLDLPYRAAVVLEGGLEEGSVEPDAAAYEQLSNSWIAAREYEKAAAPLARAAELSEGGDLYVRLAQVHIQREKWSEAAEALRRALDKGELANQGDAQLLMGIAYYSQKEPQQALRWFARARQHEATRQEAEVWVRYIERELGSG